MYVSTSGAFVVVGVAVVVVGRVRIRPLRIFGVY